MKRIQLIWDVKYQTKAILLGVVQQPAEGISFAELLARCKVLDAIDLIEPGQESTVVEPEVWEKLVDYMLKAKYAVATRELRAILHMVLGAKDEPRSDSLPTGCVSKERVPDRDLDGASGVNRGLDTGSFESERMDPAGGEGESLVPAGGPSNGLDRNIPTDQYVER